MPDEPYEFLRGVPLWGTLVDRTGDAPADLDSLGVVQLTSPETPGNEGFSPRPTPRRRTTCAISLRS